MAIQQCTGNTPAEVFAIAGIEVLPPSDITTGAGGYIRTATGGGDLQALGAVGRNRSYVEQLRRKVGTFLSRANQAKLRSPQRFYNPRTGQYQAWTPYTDATNLTTTDTFIQTANQLAVLVYNRIIDVNARLGIPTIDRNTGSNCVEEEAEVRAGIEQALGFPSSGLLTISARANDVDKFGYTHTATDMAASAVYGNVVVPVRGLTGIAWSLHQDKIPNRRLHEKRTRSRTKGTATIAGTLIFAIFNEDPIRAITPNQFFHGNSTIGDSSTISNFVETLATELPAFDLSITFSNEYGSVASMNLWGVDITDSGGSVTSRQLENELVVQYTAIDMDPIKPLRTDSEGGASFLSSEGQELYQKRRRMALMEEYASRNFEEMYNSYVDDFHNQIRYGISKVERNNKNGIRRDTR